MDVYHCDTYLDYVCVLYYIWLITFFHYLKPQRKIRLFDGCCFPTKSFHSKRKIFFIVSGRERIYTFRANL